MFTVKRITIGVLSVSILGLIIIWTSGGDEDQRIAQKKLALNQAQIAVYDLLTTQRGLSLDALIMGVATGEGRYDFRGAVIDHESRIVPLYGEVELVCAEPSSAPDCWRAVRLEIDGRTRIEEPSGQSMVALASAAGPEEPAGLLEQAVSDAPAEPEAIAEEQASEQMPEPDVAPEASARLETAPPATEAEPAPAARFRVVDPIVNGRGGPGKEHDTVRKVTPDTELTLLSASGEWRQFVDAANPDAGSFWIFAPLTTEVE